MTAPAVSIADVVTPKLTALQARIEEIKTHMQESGAYRGVAHDLAELADDVEKLRRLAELLVAQTRGLAD